MLPGKRNSTGAIYVLQGPPPAGTPFVGGIAVSQDGAIYVSQAFTPPFSPASLFASGEQGAWYDPSDLTTMFQDRAGTTPVTADGQPVGLILDKSKQLVTGSNTCPAFDAATWNAVGALPSGWVMSGGILTVTAGAQWSKASTTLTGNSLGKWFKATIDVASISGTIIAKPWGGWNTNYVFESDISTPGLKTIYFYSDDATAGFEFQSRSAGLSCVINSITIQEVAGNHASQATAAARPLYKTAGLAKYNDYDVVDDVLNTTFPSSLGSSCTVAKAVVGGSPTILTGQTIGTSWAESTDNAGVVIVNRALTPQETTDLTAWLTTKGATT